MLQVFLEWKESTMKVCLFTYIPSCFLGTSLVPQTVKNLPEMQETWV